MASGMPLAPGDSEIDQIFKIFRLVSVFPLNYQPFLYHLLTLAFHFLLHSILGTPTTEIWPGLVQMPDFKPTFPKWNPQNLTEVLPEMDERGLHLLAGMLTYDPSRRISGRFLF